MLSDDPSRFEVGSVFQLDPDPGAGTITVDRTREHQGRLIVKFDGFDDRNQAETIRGAKLFVEPGSLRALEDDTFWQMDLEGLEVFDVEGRRLGVVDEVLTRQDQDLWKVATDGEDVLVPAVKAIVKHVDLEARKVILDPPVGLFGEAE